MAGSALAWAGYEMGRRILAATVIFDGGRFFLVDVAVPGWTLALVLVGMPVLAVLSTIASLRRVQVDPLGISRRGRRPAPSAWKALPLAVGIGGQLALEPLQRVVSSERLNNLAGLFALLQIVGLVLVGPWLCLLVARGLARVSRGAAGLIAARRMAADPAATFRAISGVVLAATAVVYFGSIAGQTQTRSGGGSGAWLRPGVVQVYTGGVPADRVAPLLSEHTLVVRFGLQGYVAACAELSRMVDVSCPYDEQSGHVEPG